MRIAVLIALTAVLAQAALGAPHYTPALQAVRLQTTLLQYGPCRLVAGLFGEVALEYALPLPYGMEAVYRMTAEELRSEREGEARRAKCDYLWRQVAPWSYSPKLVEHFCLAHEKRGIGNQCYWSLVYGHANFGLTVGKRVGPCYGPMDVRREWARACGFKPNDLRDPFVNIACHVREMALYHDKTGETGMALLARVFYPARPMYYHRWRPTDKRFRQVLARGYRAGKLGR